MTITHRVCDGCQSCIGGKMKREPEEKEEDLSASIWISTINNEWYLNIQLTEGHNEIKLSFKEFMESVKKTTENILEQQMTDKTQAILGENK